MFQDELVARGLAARQRITRPERYFMLVCTGYRLRGWREAAAQYAGAVQDVTGGGDQGWTDFDGDVASVLRFAGSSG